MRIFMQDFICYYIYSLKEFEVFSSLEDLKLKLLFNFTCLLHGLLLLGKSSKLTLDLMEKHKYVQTALVSCNLLWKYLTVTERYYFLFLLHFYKKNSGLAHR